MASKQLQGKTINTVYQLFSGKCSHEKYSSTINIKQLIWQRKKVSYLYFQGVKQVYGKFL